MLILMIIIRTLDPTDWPAVAAIYLEGIATGQATFQTAAPSWEDWDSGHLSSLRFVATEHDQIIGWIALSPVSGRCVYAGVAELSVYVAEKARGKKVGYQLLEHLIGKSEAEGIWTLQAGIFPENTASIALHQKLGFRIIGYREKVGKQHGVWRNVNLLERRSRIAGTN
jgi:L-amino acid N-acyltransferase YncA